MPEISAFVTFGELLKHLRMRAGLTQREFGLAVGYSHTHVGRLENGKRLPDVEVVRALFAGPLCIQNDPAVLERLIALAIATHGDQTPAPMNATQTHHPRVANLPAQLTRFIGRERDIAFARDALLRDDAFGLLTLAGPPGVGKTRLAIEVARSLSDEFADGVCFVALAPLVDAGMVGMAILEALGGPVDTGQPVSETLRQRLRDKQVLLVLDNFEHVLDAAPLVAGLMAATPRLKVLATSRAVLRVSGEVEYEVAPLAVPDLAHIPPAHLLQDWPAIELFMQRARECQPDFALSPSNGRAVVDICRRVDGLPLAIELAAVRIRMFTPQTLLAQLDHHLGSALQLLSHGPRDLPPRQQTLRATLDWSYQLLNVEEQALLQRLAVFAGGCTLEAVQAVCGCAEGDALIANLQSLIDKSLARQVERNGGESRYVMLETIREYALERLEASGNAESTRRRHVRYFARKCEVDINSPAWPIVCTGLLEGFTRERDNLYAALGWSTGYDDEPLLHLSICTIVAWLAVVGHWYLGMRGNARAIKSELERSLVRNPNLSPIQRAIPLHTLGLILLYLGDNDQSARAGSESLALSLATGALGIAASAAHVCGHNAYATGNLALAERFFEQQLELGERTGAVGWVLNGLNMLGDLALDRRDFGRAAGLLERALALSRSSGIQKSILSSQATVLQTMSVLAYEQGEYALACESGYQSLRLNKEEAEVRRRYIQLLYLGRTVLAQQRLSLAEQHLMECLCMAREYGLRVWYPLALLAQVAAQQDDMARYARLTGVVASKWLSNSPPWSILSIHVHHQCLAAIAKAETHLSEPAFAAAWADGQCMTLDKAVEYALQTGYTR